MRVGVDTGGTFTDFVLFDGARRWTRKLPSTPDDPARAVLDGLEGAAQIVHGSTVATNALLEGKGARIAFVATAGFEDLLELARQNRRSLYDWLAPVAPVLAERSMRFGVAERTVADGSIETPLEPASLESLVAALRERNAGSVAVCLLHSYANPLHERLVGEALRSAGFAVSLSHEILPEYREYERAATTAVNAAVSPVMARYLSALQAGLPPGARLRVFQSNGGSMSAAAAGQRAVETVLSGPAGGVLGAAAVARAAGMDKFISFDMGGTSTDVALFDGAFRFTNEAEVGGFPIRVAALDIHTVGAGGGSIARFDAGGALRVGPQSAGASPGPVCYGQGDELTVTDANLALGRIDPERFLSGEMRLDADRARRALEQAAAQAGATAAELAQAIVRGANANMERAIRAISVERGRDPREYALVAFGGAGPQHACELADRLEIATVLVPKDAGVLSALGMLTADFAREYSLTILDGEIEPAYRRLEQRAAKEFAEEGFSELRFERRLDLRYKGQSFEITLPYSERHEFHAAHERLYGYSDPARKAEAVTARLRAAAIDPDAAFELSGPSDRQDFTSVYAPPGWSVQEDSVGNTILRRGEGRRSRPPLG